MRCKTRKGKLPDALGVYSKRVTLSAIVAIVQLWSLLVQVKWMKVPAL